MQTCAALCGSEYASPVRPDFSSARSAPCWMYCVRHVLGFEAVDPSQLPTMAGYPTAARRAPRFARCVSSIHELKALPKSSIPSSKIIRSGKTSASSTRAVPSSSPIRLFTLRVRALRVRHRRHARTDLVEEAGDVCSRRLQGGDRQDGDQPENQRVLDQRLTLLQDGSLPDRNPAPAEMSVEATHPAPSLSSALAYGPATDDRLVLTLFRI